MPPLSLERMLLWTINITRHVEARTLGKVYALRPEVVGDKPFLRLLCLPEDVSHFILVVADVAPMMGAVQEQRTNPDDYLLWVSIIIPLPAT